MAQIVPTQKKKSNSKTITFNPVPTFGHHRFTSLRAIFSYNFARSGRNPKLKK